MTKPVQRGAVAIAIKLPSQPASSQLQIAEVETTILKLLDRLDRQQLLLTWAIVNPVASTVAEKIAARGHEISLLVPPTSAGAQSRAEFVRSIGKQLRAATLAGCPISTVAADDSYCLEHINLLIKYGVKVVCNARNGSPASAQNICFGFWTLDASAVIAGGGWVSNRSQMRMLDRALNQAIATGGICHVQFDLGSILTTENQRSLQTLEVALASLAQLRDDDRIEICTVAELARKMSSHAKVAPARSILRAA
jgi:hypothetical protein